MFCTDIPNPMFLIFSSYVPHLLYYSHIPSAIIALFLGFYIYYKSRTTNDLASKLLFAIGVTFFTWVLFDLIIWTNNSISAVMFFWSLINILEMLISALTLYFAYVFLEKKDVALRFKLFFAILLSAFIVFIPTKFNLTGFNYDNCESIQGPLLSYYYVLEILFSLILLIYLIRKIIISKSEERKMVVYFSVGVICFLASFSGANVVASLTEQWQILQYGLFGMPIFMAFLVYIIIKYKAFNIRLLGAQALVVALIILIGSQFFFIKTLANQVLTGITFFLSSSFGWVLVRSVKKEVQQNEKLTIANEEINKRKQELQKISDSLAISNDKLKQLDSAKTEFISMASHQLRTPVTGIKGYLSMLLEGSYGEVTSEQKVAMQKAYDSNERMVTLIEDLLNVSRIESGRLEYEFTGTKIEDLCQEVVNTLFPKAIDRGLYLEYDKPEIEMPKVWIDGIKVREVISNLVDNALKYTPRGGVRLRVDLCDRKEAACLLKPHIRITVSDTGIGIPKEEIPFLFNKFSRGKDISRLNAGGTGLGLYVGRKMIEGNAGKVWLESEGKDKGSRFIIELPVGESEVN